MRMIPPHFFFSLALAFLSSIRFRQCPGLTVLLKEIPKMKSLLQFLILSAVAFISAIPAAYALPGPVPEPEPRGLVAIGALALLVSRFRKRK